MNMKNIILYSLLFICCAGILSSCEKDEITGTATEAMAGEWYVIADAIDADGNVVYEDPFGNHHFHLDTYNTSGDGTSEMWIDDNENFWEFKNKININLSELTFDATDAQNVTYDSKVTIKDGKILLGAATTPSGMPADSIVFIVNFDDDTNPEDYGFESYRIAGIRYTGLTGDE